MYICIYVYIYIYIYIYIYVRDYVRMQLRKMYSYRKPFSSLGMESFQRTVLTLSLASPRWLEVRHIWDEKGVWKWCGS
jgi:hypothetical protein